VAEQPPHPAAPIAAPAPPHPAPAPPQPTPPAAQAAPTLVSQMPPPPSGTSMKMPPGIAQTPVATTSPEVVTPQPAPPAPPVPPAQNGSSAVVSQAPEPLAQPTFSQGSVAHDGRGPAFPTNEPASRNVVSDLAGLDDATRMDRAIKLGQALVTNLRHVVLGTPGAITAVAVAALSGGHLLIEDVPGVGKTVLAQALAISLGTDLSRLQGHPDLLPSDVTGVSVFSPDTGTWEFKPGPVFAHVVLVDELNRTPPRTQAALLETMEEQQVSADGQSFALPVPHMVIATQNPYSQLGTYPLVESQLDRFALATAIGYPDADVETQIVMQHGGRPALSDLQPICDPEQWHQAQLATQSVVVEESIASYAVALCRGSRSVAGVRLGASPRAAIWLVRTAQAHAVLAGRAYVIPGDVKAMALSCLSHRLTTDEGVLFGVKVVRALLESTPAPRP